MDNHTEKPSESHDWQEIWQRNIKVIDEQLSSLFRETSEKAEDLTEQAKTKIQDMLDKTDMDEKARANWDKAKADGKLVGAQVENRIAHLVADGKIAWAKLTKKDAGE